MSKRIGIVADMVNKAMVKGVANVTHYNAERKSNILKVYHYGTLILEYNTTTNTIVQWGGYSVSDRDALNTILTRCVDYGQGDVFYIKQRILQMD